MTAALVIIAVYAVGFIATWFIAASWWCRQFRVRGGFEAVVAGAWGLMAALLWPVLAPAALVGLVVSR